MDLKYNNIIIDLDLVWDYDIRVLVFYKALGYLRDKNIDEYIYKRAYKDDNINPLYRLFDVSEKEEVDKIYEVITAFRDRFNSVQPMTENIRNLISNFVFSDNMVKVSILCHPEEKEIVEKAFKHKDASVDILIKDKKNLINFKNYDTIYIRTFDTLNYFNCKDIERRTIYTANIRCNFMDDKMEVLHTNFLPLGLKNDVFVIDLYEIDFENEIKENKKEDSKDE